jgi:hypothetical protein
MDSDHSRTKPSRNAKIKLTDPLDWEGLMKTNGSCLCGNISFSINLPSKWVAHCHCSLCQRSSGAAFVTWVGVAESDCDILDEGNRLTWFSSTAEGQRGFCSRCGSSIFFRSPRWPNELHVTRANIHGPVDRLPQAHVFWDSHADWVSLSDGDGLPRKTADQMQ